MNPDDAVLCDPSDSLKLNVAVFVVEDSVLCGTKLNVAPVPVVEDFGSADTPNVAPDPNTDVVPVPKTEELVVLGLPKGALTGLDAAAVLEFTNWKLGPVGGPLANTVDVVDGPLLDPMLDAATLGILTASGSTSPPVIVLIPVVGRGLGGAVSMVAPLWLFIM